jgi:nucleoside-diphosphate-sugar epimerase
MKLIVVGATGFVGREVLRLALRNTSIASVVAATRREVLPFKQDKPDLDISKLRCVLIGDWEKPYPDHVIEQILAAYAYIWLVPLSLRV